MKPSSKAVMIGCISFFVFLYGNLLFGGLVGSLIPGGDDFINSYFYPLYTAVTLLISLIISCTYLILKKINLLLDKMKEKQTCVSQIGVQGGHMSFTMSLLLAYIVMGVGSFIAFKRKHKAIGIALLLVIVLSVLILGYMWIHSPM